MEICYFRALTLIKDIEFLLNENASVKLTDDIDEAMTAYEVLDRRNHIQAEENDQDRIDFEEVVSQSSIKGLKFVAGYIDQRVGFRTKDNYFSLSRRVISLSLPDQHSWHNLFTLFLT